MERIAPMAVCFDLDGTLLDGSGLQASIVRTCEAIAQRQPLLDADKLLRANSAEWHRYWAEVEHAWDVGTLSGAEVGHEAWRRTLVACGSPDAALVEFAAALHGRLANGAHRLFDDAAPAVAAVRERGMRLALVTNGASDTQRSKISALGIDDWFDAIVVTGEIGSAKPDVTPFQTALEALGAEATAAWHVGDSLGADVAGANAAGLASVWLNRDQIERRAHDPTPDVELRSLRQLESILD